MLNDVLRGAGVAELRSAGAGAGTGVPVPGNANTRGTGLSYLVLSMKELEKCCRSSA